MFRCRVIAHSWIANVMQETKGIAVAPAGQEMPGNDGAAVNYDSVALPGLPFKIIFLTQGCAVFQAAWSLANLAAKRFGAPK